MQQNWTGLTHSACAYIDQTHSEIQGTLLLSCLDPSKAFREWLPLPEIIKATKLIFGESVLVTGVNGRRKSQVEAKEVNRLPVSSKTFLKSLKLFSPWEEFLEDRTSN